MTHKEICYDIIRTASAKKADDMKLLDVTGKSDICDFQIICTSQNEVHSRAITDAIEARFRDAHRLKPYVIEGKSTGQWILMDYGSILVHIFLKEFLDVYAIEKIWPSSAVEIAHLLS